MSGTSMDGLDLACCTFTWEGDQYTFTLDQAETIPFDPRWKSRLLYLEEQSGEIFAKTHVYLGHFLGEHIRGFIDRHGLQPDFVAIHGQTIFHQPERNFTAQIGDGETVVSYLNCPLVSNFRNKDLALGGQGAPLIPLGEHHLFPAYRLFLNLGGFCNLTYGGTAFDVAPCNIVLNHVYRQRVDEGGGRDYDPGGTLAASGMLDGPLLKALDALPYYEQAPPKSLGWEWVQGDVLPILDDWLGRPQDFLHTFCVHVARQIAAAVRQTGAQDQPMLVTGGGRYHQFLMDRLQAELAPLGITIATDAPAGWVDFKEAIVFAFLGLRTLQGRPTTLASVTGARQDVVTGSIHLPPSGGWALFPD